MSTKLRKALKRSAPGLAEERAHWEAGRELVVGIDEVGRGSWAGPLTIGAVIAPNDRRLYKLRDSKQLRPAERELMHDRVLHWARAAAVGHAWPEECDELGMSAAQRLAARRALEALGVVPDAVLLDGNWDFVGHPVTRKLIKGDQRSASIAAASILAKVTRDRIMVECAENYPGFDFELNKGYPCPQHRTALAWNGPTAIHRRAWVFMDGLPWSGLRRVVREDQLALFDR